MVVSKPIYSVQIHVILPLPSKRCTNNGHSNNFLCKFMFFYHYYPKEGPRVSITKPISTVQRHALSSLFSSFDSGAVVTNPIFSEQNTWICHSYSTYGTYAEITKFLLAKIFYLSIEIMDRGRWFKKHFLHATTCFFSIVIQNRDQLLIRKPISANQTNVTLPLSCRYTHEVAIVTLCEKHFTIANSTVNIGCWLLNQLPCKNMLFSMIFIQHIHQEWWSLNQFYACKNMAVSYHCHSNMD